MQIISITSEALQATIRRLLPSQAGFSEDLEAVNTIQPIIDLTPTAEGSQLPVQLQQAINFGGATNVAVEGTSNTFSLTPGFYRVTVTISLEVLGTGVTNALMVLFDGASSKTICEIQMAETLNTASLSNFYDLIVFVRTGDSIVASADTDCTIVGTIRQVADVYGNLINPVGFSFE
tara:strand:+ start:109 stop:639 length:531 start_codon:yes stop_codon:yes gene_type:complete